LYAEGEYGWTDLLLGQVVWQIGDHDLVLGGHTVLRRAALAGLTGLAGFTRLPDRLLLGSLIARDSSALDNVALIVSSSGSVGQGEDLPGLAFALSLHLISFCSQFGCGSAHATTTGTATATATSTTAATAGVPLARLVLGTGGHSLGRLLGGCFGLASELDRHLAAQDLLARQLGDGTLGLGSGGEVHEGVPHRAGGAWVDRD